MSDLETIPHGPDSERCLLGMMLQDPARVADIRPAAAVEAFFVPAHQRIARTIYDLADQHEGGLIPVRDALAQRGQLAGIGHGTDEKAGAEYLTDLFMDFSFDVGNLDYHIRAVRNAATLRELATMGAEIKGDVSPGADAGELLRRYQERLFKLDANADHGRGLVEVADAVDAAISRADAVAAGTASAGFQTGFSAIDRPTGGMGPGDVWVLAAGTSVGKTSLALAMTANVADAGAGVLFVSCEMDRLAITNRLLSSLARIPSLRLRTGNLDPAEHQARTDAAAKLRTWRLAIEDGAATVAEIGARARQLAARWVGPPALIVVDYLQLLTPTTGDTRAQEVSGAVWGLKRLSMSLGIPVLCLSQLNREGLKTGNPPSLTALKESGDIENHASVVLLLHRPNPPEHDTTGKPVIWAKVAKARDGQITTWPQDGYSGIKLRFLPEYARFEELTL